MHAQSELQPLQNRALLVRRALIGAGIALALISLFLSGVNNPKPEWPQFWYLRPLIIVPLAGATGGICYHLKDFVNQFLGWNKAVVTVLAVLVYIVGLWMGTVLGLDGTLWD